MPLKVDPVADLHPLLRLYARASAPKKGRPSA